MSLHKMGLKLIHLMDGPFWPKLICGRDKSLATLLLATLDRMLHEIYAARWASYLTPL